MRSKLYPKIVFFAVLLALTAISLYIVKPFIPALITGALIAYLSYPLYEKVHRIIRNQSLAAFIVTIFIVLIFSAPVVFVLKLAFDEAHYYTSYLAVNRNNLGSNFLSAICQNEQWALCRATKSAFSIIPGKTPDFYINTIVQKISGFIIETVENLASSLFSIIFDFFVMLFIIYYLYKDGYIVYSRVKNMLPVDESNKNRVINRFNTITRSVFYGNILVAAIQGSLGTIGFIAVGINSPFLWGMVIALCSFLPLFGTAFVWLPAAINFILVGYIQNSSSATFKGIFLLLYGLLVLSTIDHILKPKIIGDKANVHPILVLIGVLGGIKVFGLTGLILGPVVLALVVILIELYEEQQLGIKNKLKKNTSQ